MDKVSIITTCYNAENYIQYAIESVFNQKLNTNLQVEYIIINDCSTDNSLDIISKYSSINSIKYIVYNLKENIGCGSARKIGIECATGDYFMFLDADDYYINDDFVNRAVNDIKENDADIVEYGILHNKKYSISIDKKTEITNLHSKLKALFIDNVIKFNVWSKIYKREIVKSFPYSIERIYEDVRTIPIWVANSNKIVIMPSLEINYRDVKTSIIRNNDISTRLGTIRAISELFEIFKNDKTILKYMYDRALIDLEAILDNKCSLDEGFDEMSKLNTKMLSYIYPETYKEITFNIEEE